MESDEDNRENRGVAFGGLLSTHLRRLSDLRASMPPEERNPPPVLYVVEETPRVLPPPVPRATPEQIIRELAILDVVFPSQALAPEERSLRYQIYCLDLAELTEEELVDACACIRKDASVKFFPSPGQILDNVKYRRIYRKLYGDDP